MLLIREEINHKHISIKKFYLRRAIRILPALYFFFFCIAIVQLLGYIHIKSISWITAITFTKSYFTRIDSGFNHLWSLSIEEQFYIIWPILFYRYKQQRNLLIVIFILIVPVFRILFNMFYTSEHIIKFLIINRGDAIAMGCLLALNKDKILNFLSNKWNYLLPIATIILFALPHFPNMIDSITLLKRLHIGYLLVPLGTTHGSIANIIIGFFILYAVYVPKTILYQFLNTKLMNYIGLLSYSLYLWQILLSLKHNKTLLYSFTTFEVVLQVIIISICSYSLIEKPFLRLKSRYEV